MDCWNLENRITYDCGQLAVTFKDPSSFLEPQQRDYSFTFGRKCVRIPSRKTSLPSPPLPPVPPSTPVRDKSLCNVSPGHKDIASYPLKSPDTTHKRFTFPAPSGHLDSSKPNPRRRAGSWILGDDSETQVDASSPGPSMYSDADTATMSENDHGNQQCDDYRYKPLQRSRKASSNLHDTLTQNHAQPASRIPEPSRPIYRKPVPSPRKMCSSFIQSNSSRRFSWFEKRRSSSTPLITEIRASAPLLNASSPSPTTLTENSLRHDDDICAAARTSSAFPQSFMDFESDDEEPMRSTAARDIFCSLANRHKSHQRKTRLRRTFSNATSTFRTIILCGG